MSEPDQLAPTLAGPDFQAEIATLREQGADQLDPVRFHYIATLAGQALLHQGEVRRILDTRLASALNEYRERLPAAVVTPPEPPAPEPVETPPVEAVLVETKPVVALPPVAAPVAGGEVEVAPRPEKPVSPLAELTRQIEQQGQESPEGGLQASLEVGIEPRAELKAVRNFRKTWSKLSVDKQLAQAIGQVPENAGPLNSHLLVIRALTQMRDIAPDYLNRFMSYVDALLWLEQASKPVEKAAPARKRAKK